MELETVEKKKLELDVIVARAPGWQFPLGDQHVLILDESKTRRTGWVGHILSKCLQIDMAILSISDPVD